VTLGLSGTLGALSDGIPEHMPPPPIRGLIDVVGVDGGVTANPAAALAARAGLSEAMELAIAAASVVTHQVGTTRTASVAQIAALATQATTSTS
jgi:bifunctional ADP-heptose synthase (sugar kinase/adenylyltransferase)